MSVAKKKVETWTMGQGDDQLAQMLGRFVEGKELPPGTEPEAETGSAKPPAKPNYSAKVSRETAGRKGKGVTVVTVEGMSPEELSRLGTDLKQKCGSGGTVKDERIEIQGEHRDRIMAELQARGFRVKRSGG